MGHEKSVPGTATAPEDSPTAAPVVARAAVERLPVCGHESYLAAELVPLALKLAPEGSSVAEDVRRDLSCSLQEHSEGVDHHCFVMELAGIDTGSVWTSWPSGEQPASVFTMPDCTVHGPGDEDICEEFEGHLGGHTWQLDHPWLTKH